MRQRDSSKSTERKQYGPKKSLKICIRLLPPSLTEEEFIRQLGNYSSFFTEKTTEPFYYVKGAEQKKPFERPEYSRAYLLFKSQLQLDQFANDLRGKPFREPGTNDNMIPDIGAAIFNGMPSTRQKTRRISQLANIQKNAYFKEFLSHLQNGDLASFDLNSFNRKLREQKREQRGKVHYKKSQRGTSENTKGTKKAKPHKEDEATKEQNRSKNKRVRRKATDKNGSKSAEKNIEKKNSTSSPTPKLTKHAKTRSTNNLNSKPVLEKGKPTGISQNYSSDYLKRKNRKESTLSSKPKLLVRNSSPDRASEKSNTSCLRNNNIKEMKK